MNLTIKNFLKSRKTFD